MEESPNLSGLNKFFLKIRQEILSFSSADTDLHSNQRNPFATTMGNR
jgi:hypothetical protein